MRPGPARRPIADRFWEKVDRSAGPEACWIWTASRRAGYGQFNWAKYDMRKAHRVSWELSIGEIPDGLWVLHHCDNPPCVNPSHLFLGTQTDNMQDCSAKGRLVPRVPVGVCKKGHPLVGDNALKDGGHLRCRICRNVNQRMRRWAKNGLPRSHKPKARDRKTICKNGHAMTPDNSRLTPDGIRLRCRQCVRDMSREYRLRLKHRN